MGVGGVGTEGRASEFAGVEAASISGVSACASGVEEPGMAPPSDVSPSSSLWWGVLTALLLTLSSHTSLA